MELYADSTDASVRMVEVKGYRDNVTRGYSKRTFPPQVAALNCGALSTLWFQLDQRDYVPRLIWSCAKNKNTDTDPSLKRVKGKQARTLIPPPPPVRPSPPSPLGTLFVSQALLGPLPNSDDSSNSATFGVQEVLTTRPRVCRVLVVDDGSSLEDRTAMMEAFPRFTYVFKGAGDTKGGKRAASVRSVSGSPTPCFHVTFTFAK